MKIVNKELFIPKNDFAELHKLSMYCSEHIKIEYPSHLPIRFVVTENTDNGCKCEIDFVVAEGIESELIKNVGSIFDFKRREYENSDKFTAVLIIPTGIGAEIGGHCGDGNVAARILASACDTLITHPNVVNASDLNEMTENTLYVEGSILTRLFMGSIGLQKVLSNKILMLMDKSGDKYFNDEIINAVSSARVTLGIDCDVLEMKDTIESCPIFTESERAAGNIGCAERLFDVVAMNKKNYDAIGLATMIDVEDGVDEEYFKTDKEVVNPWGGIEAMITHSVAELFKIPCAHSPLSGSMQKNHLDMDLGIVDPRKAPETASITYLHCILKGLHRSPRLVSYNKGINVENISCLVIPDGCIGLPVLACIEQGIPVIAVRNKNRMKNDLTKLPFRKGKLFFAENYLEAAGIMTAIKAGVSLDSIERPIRLTNVL